jgi:hypothetical protein
MQKPFALANQQYNDSHRDGNNCAHHKIIPWVFSVIIAQEIFCNSLEN